MNRSRTKDITLLTPTMKPPFYPAHFTRNTEKSVVANRNTKQWTAEIEKITIAATRCVGVE
jgi:hypothetical protein